MRNIVLATTFATALAALATGCRGTSDTHTAQIIPTAGSGAIVVTVRNKAYDLDEIQVEAGATTTITLQNTDDTQHSLTVYVDDSFEGVKVADTGLVPPGERRDTTVLFTTGEHAFRCEVHPGTMRGTIVVR